MDSVTAAAYRKIELQSPEDFAYLVDNVRRAAAESVDAAFPPVDGDRGGGAAAKDDDLHLRIEELVNEVSSFKFGAPIYVYIYIYLYVQSKKASNNERMCSTSGRRSPSPRPT